MALTRVCMSGPKVARVWLWLDLSCCSLDSLLRTSVCLLSIFLLQHMKQIHIYSFMGRGGGGGGGGRERERERGNQGMSPPPTKETNSQVNVISAEAVKEMLCVCSAKYAMLCCSVCSTLMVIS